MSCSKIEKRRMCVLTVIERAKCQVVGQCVGQLAIPLNTKLRDF